MKRIITNLFVVVLLMLSATSWAQNGIKISVHPGDGVFGAESGYCKKWTSTSGDYPVEISVGVNNLVAGAVEEGFGFYPGSSKFSTWNFTVNGCKILSYSFKYKLQNNGSITITAGSSTYTPTATAQEMTVENVNAMTATIDLSGDNKCVVITELEFVVEPILEVGQVYMFKNARANRSLSADGADDVHTKATDATDVKQQWYVTSEGDYFVLRNLACGKYLKGNGMSSAWSLTDDYSHEYNKFELCVSNTNYSTLHTKTLGGYAYMHDDNNDDNGGYNIVGWSNENSDTGSHWTITKVDYTGEDIKALLDAAPTIAEVEGYDDALAAIFADAACTVLNGKYASMSVDDIKADANYIALPATLQSTILKIRNDDWSEANAVDTKEGWNSEYAKKFRVQMYEPYSIAGDITSWVGLNSHANNDNPTGIYVPKAGNLFIMVEGEIKQGATLRIVDAGSNNRILNATTGGNTLQQGLNVVKFTQAGGMLYICYNVDTYDPDGTDVATMFPNKLSDYAPLKIHIEGGAINGFYNACGDFRATTDEENLWKTYTGANVDADADWTYMETRANLSVIPIIGHREILLLQLEDEQNGRGLRSLLPESVNCPPTPYSYAQSWAEYGMGCDPEKGKINIVVEAWDRIMYSQLATMGLVSKDDMDRMNELYPRWNADGTRGEVYNLNTAGLDGNTYQQFCRGLDYSEYFNHHGVILGTSSGNPYGSGDHVGYPIGGFADVIYDLPYTAGSTWGPAHEIGHQHQGLLTLNGLTEVTNNLFSNISLWYKGMSTSRYNGKDGSLESVLAAFNTPGSDIYTNNIWALTHLYYRLWLYYHLAGNNTQFYPRLFELLRQNQMQKGVNVFGDTSTLHFYKLVCQAAGEDLTEFFRAHGYFSVMENRFVGDYSNSIYNVSQQMIDEAIAQVKEMGYRENLSIIFINDDDDTANYLQHDGQTKRVIYGETTPNSDFGSVSDFIAGDVATAPYTATLNSDGTITMSGGQGGVGFLILNEKGELLSFSNKSTFALGDQAMKAIASGNATINSVGSESNVVEAKVNIATLQKQALGALISKAQLLIDKIDDTYTKIGYYKPAALASLSTVLAYAQEVYACSSGYEAAYDLLYTEYAKVLENNDARIPFNPSLTYIITNKAYAAETMWVNGSKAVRSESGVDQTSNNARWKFVETSTAGVYNIRTLNNDYIPAVKQSASMTATAGKADDDALYTLEEVMDGVWAIKLSPAAGYRNLHSSWNDVVGWTTSSNASQWYLTAVEADPDIADLTDLEVYINKTEQLLDEVLGTVAYTKGEQLSLQTTSETSAYYVWSNAPEDSEGDIANLVDGAVNNYFHTEWSSEPKSGTHYLCVDLGKDNTLPCFTISHTTRANAQSDFPRSVDVYGADEKDGTYKYLGSVSGMPQSAGAAWEFDGMMVSSHRYLRFNYHANRGYWHMAEFDITPITGFTATVNDIYNATVDVDVVEAAMNAMLEGKRIAKSTYPTNVEAQLQKLQQAYNALYAQYKETLNQRRGELAALVSQSEELISEMGEIAFAQENKLDLTTENLYCNDPHLHADKNHADYSEKYVDKLTDGDVSTFLHTDYSNTNSNGTFPHYLRVDLGENSTATGFRFTYTTRDNGNNCPTEIEVAGCDKPNGEYTTICTLKDTDSNPLPNGKALVYNSSVISRQPTYRYIRFTVTKTEGTANTFFVMSEFGFKTVANEVAVYDAYKSYLTGEQLLTSVLATNSSKEMSTNELVTSVPMLNEQIASQQSVYDALCAVELSASSHTLVVGNAGWATLFLGNSTIIPSTVEAFIVSKVGDSSVTLTKVDGVLPACQGVVVKAAAGDYDFVRTTDAAKCDFTANQLMGTLVDTKVETTAYVLGIVDDEVGFYRAVTAGYADGTFLNNANKAYLPMSNTNGAASYSFRFGDDATGVEEVKTENENVKTICDLTGRRVEAITSPGFYIVNGRKILVK